MNEFTLQETVALIYRQVVLKDDLIAYKQKTDITLIGHVCGVLTLNDQIEVVVKFFDDLKQFNKEEFFEKVQLIDA